MERRKKWGTGREEVRKMKIRFERIKSMIFPKNFMFSVKCESVVTSHM